MSEIKFPPEWKVLNLTLKKKWFDMFLSGIKKEDYREIKPYWDVRILGGAHTHILFRNGYGNHRPFFVIEYNLLSIGKGKIEWGAPKNEDVYVLKCGSIVMASENIICPECRTKQQAVIEQSIPFWVYIHDCEKCGFTIMESDWEEVPEVTEKEKIINPSEWCQTKIDNLKRNG